MNSTERNYCTYCGKYIKGIDGCCSQECKKALRIDSHRVEKFKKEHLGSFDNGSCEIKLPHKGLIVTPETEISWFDRRSTWKRKPCGSSIDEDDQLLSLYAGNIRTTNRF